MPAFAVARPEDCLGSCVSVDDTSTITIMYACPNIATAGSIVGQKTGDMINDSSWSDCTAQNRVS